MMEQCKELRDYAIFVDKVRNYAADFGIVVAVDLAVEECIKEDVMTEFLSKHRAEVKQMSIFEYDEEKEMRLMREAYAESGYEEGLEAGLEAGLEQGQLLILVRLVCKQLIKGQSDVQIAEILGEDTEKISKLCKKAKEYAPEYDVNEICDAILKEKI